MWFVRWPYLASSRSDKTTLFPICLQKRIAETLTQKTPAVETSLFKFPFLYFQYNQWKADWFVLESIIKHIESFIDFSTEFAFCISLAYLRNHKTGNNFFAKMLKPCMHYNVNCFLCNLCLRLRFGKVKSL